MQKNRTNTMLAVLLLLHASLATTASARPGGGEGRRGPPPEAIEACEGKSANDPCSFTGRRDDTIEGTCFAPPDIDQLACAPEGGPPERGGR
jgi:hypothetical protein